MDIEFVKMESMGNDFVIIEDIHEEIKEKFSYNEIAKNICDRKQGIGSDACVFILDSISYDVKFLIYDYHGKPMKICGNGIRCFAKYVYEKKTVNKKKFKIETYLGMVNAVIETNQYDEVLNISIEMGEPKFDSLVTPLILEKDKGISEILDLGITKVTITAVSIGIPNAVIFVDNIEDAPVTILGPLIENHTKFPEKTNAVFVEIRTSSEINMRIWERGEGETSSCISGACAALVAANLNGLSKQECLVKSPGGEITIRWDTNSNKLYQIGSAKLVFEGTINLNIFKET